MLTLWLFVLANIGLFMWFDERVYAVVFALLLAQIIYWLWHRRNPYGALTAPLLALALAGLFSYQGTLLPAQIEAFGNLPVYRIGLLSATALAFMGISRYYDPAQTQNQIARAGLLIFGQGALGMLWFRLIGLARAEESGRIWNIIVGRPTYAAAMFVVLLPCGALLRARWQKIVYYLCAAVCLLDFWLPTAPGEKWLSQRAAIMALGAMLAVYGFTRSPLSAKTRRIMAVLSVIVLCGLLVALVWVRPSTVGVRFDLWRAAGHDFTHNPLRGVGIGKYYVFGPTGEPQRAASFAHNMPLTIAAEMGLLGLAAFAWLLWELWRTRARRALAANLALIGYGVFSLYNDPWLWWNTTILVAAVMATTAPSQS